MMKRIMEFLLIFCISCTMCSCSTESRGIVGTWKITECIIDGEPLADLNECFFIFEEDHTGKKIVLSEEEFSFSYSFDGSSCILYNLVYPDGTIDAGSYAEMTVTGDTMTVQAVEDGIREQVLLKRQK